jgi:hypothetical protein
MFNSAILDVIIGLAFVYTMLSMICSALTEWFARFMSLRSKTLAKGIKSLLGEMDTEKLYEHPLIKGLTTKKGKPSYIPAHTFFLAVMDIIMSPKQPNHFQIKPNETEKIEEVRQVVASLPSDSVIKGALLERIDTIANLPSTPEEKATLLNQIDGIAKVRLDTLIKRNMLDDIDAQIVKLQNIIAAEDQSTPPTETTKDLEKIHEFKAAVAMLPLDSGIKNMFFTLINTPEIALMDDEKEQLKRVQKKAEKWFDDAMDRVSGWYKRNTQLFILFCALVVTVAANVDTLKIINQLWYEYDETTGSALVSAAEGLIRDRDKLESLEAPMEKLMQIQEELQRQPLPIGWHKGEFERFVEHFKDEGPARIPGWLLTTIAVSLGAPFWFQLLNKIVSLRSTGNRPPKASEEKTE